MSTNPPHGGTPMASPSLPPADIQPCTGAQALLQNPLVRDGIAERQARRARTAERYNVFDALGIGRRENYHSRFIAYLLDPAGLHDQGAVFLRSLLNWFCERKSLPTAVVTALSVGQALAPTAAVHTELHTPEHGRIDLVVELSNGTTIAIENKVDAKERERQIQDYSDYLESLPAERRKALMLVFLTADGRGAVTAGTASAPVCMSYADLAGVLENGLAQCAETAIPLIESVKHYVQLCRRIASETPDMTHHNQQLKELLLKEPAQLEAAYELAAHIALAEQGIKADFLACVVDELGRRLAEAGLQASPWSAGATADGLCVGIMAVPMGVAAPGYRCLARMRYRGWLAIGWSNPEGNTACVDEELKADMLARDYWSSEGMFAASNAMKDQPWAQPLLDWNGAVGIMAMHRDNLSDIHDLACKFAHEIWEHFQPFQERILELAERPPPSAGPAAQVP